MSAVAICNETPPAYVWVRGDFTTTTGAIGLTDIRQPYGAGFDAFVPNSSGTIEVDTAFSWSLPAKGFHAVRIEYGDTLINNVTWTAAPAA